MAELNPRCAPASKVVLYVHLIFSSTNLVELEKNTRTKFVELEERIVAIESSQKPIFPTYSTPPTHLLGAS